MSCIAQYGVLHENERDTEGECLRLLVLIDVQICQNR